jgi:hypothetical protein
MPGIRERRLLQYRLGFTADAEAGLADHGTMVNSQFINGIEVAITSLVGAMAQAAIDGQPITCVPK